MWSTPASGRETTVDRAASPWRTVVAKTSEVGLTVFAEAGVIAENRADAIEQQMIPAP
jgi:hypothetical protein